jgi:glutamyl-Q tRNA(Asp) synthetase
MVRTRFAPSPTGLLHLGHALAARVARDLARQHGGEFLLRYEDIDSTRVREEYFAGIEEDLRWLGLDWDGIPLRQSLRQEAYGAALARLREMAVVYPCFCTRAPAAGFPRANASAGSPTEKPPPGDSTPARPASAAAR